MIGLKRGIVELAPYSGRWPEMFRAERDGLLSRFGDAMLDVQHVGSTAVPGLVAKPIVDIAAAVQSICLVHNCVPSLEGLGYSYFGDRDGHAVHFFAKGPEDRRTCYLHILEVANPRWASYLAFRDLLRSDAQARAEYEELKIELAKRNPSNRRAYTEAKSAFISGMLAAAEGQ
jgi:GrpB-like predicted nucleotidyltransferase (UPF0157 family)